MFGKRQPIESLIAAFFRKLAARLRAFPFRSSPLAQEEIVAADPSVDAWNNFIFDSWPENHEEGSARWAAATAARSEGLILNGGMCSFLSNAWDVDPTTVVNAFSMIGAKQAAKELEFILLQLGRPLPTNSEEERWNVLHGCWKDSLNEIDCLSHPAELELQKALEAHVNADQEFYLTLGACRT